MGIFQTIKHSCAPQVVKGLNQFLKFSTRLAEAKAVVGFIKHCVDSNEYPRHYWKILRRNRIYPNSKTLKRHALNQHDTQHVKLLELERNIAQRIHFVDSLDDGVRTVFLSYTNNIVQSRTTKKLDSLTRSLNQLKPPTTFPPQPDRYVHNYSDLQLCDTLLECLSLGPKFCIPKRRNDGMDLEIALEDLNSQTLGLTPQSVDSLAEFKSTLVNCCLQYKKCKPRLNSPLTKDHLLALRQLQKNKDIVLSRPDKGSGIVLLNKKDYISKLDAILADQSKFTVVPDGKDLTDQIEQQLTNLLKKIKNEGYINQNLYERIKPSGSTIPRLYGLPKIHKSGVPIRPILSMVNSPYHSIAQWLVHKLEPVRQQLSKHSLRDTFQFVDTIRDLNVREKTMVSLDVTSLFTNVPLVETVSFLCKFITEKQMDIGIPVDRLRELLLRCTLNIQFLFDGKLYRQKDGVAMGSPLGPLLADIFMGMLETRQLRGTIANMEFYSRYVDDIFCVVRNGTDLGGLLDDFNDAHSALNFTMECEEEDKFSFLDVLLTRMPDGAITRRVHRKATWKGQYTHFHSFVPIRHKQNLVRCLAHRARRICSRETVNEELSLIRNVLHDNGYPDRFIDRNIGEREGKHSVATVPKKDLFLKLPFKGDVATEILTRRLRNAVSSTYYSANLRCVFSCSSLINTCTKDKLPLLTSSMVVYLFRCVCNARYVDHTARQLSTRIKEHHPKWLSQGRTGSISSAVLAHLVDSVH